MFFLRAKRFTGALLGCCVLVSVGSSTGSSPGGVSYTFPALGAASAILEGDDEEGTDWTELDLSEIETRIEKERAEIDVAAIKDLGLRETRGAMELLLKAYDLVGSTYMRREVLLALSEYDAVDDSFQAALEKLMQVAVGEPTIELREAALNGLGNARSHGKAFLQLIVESTAEDTLRERALDMHVRLADEGDFEFYDRVYKKTLKSVQEMISREGTKKARTKREREGIPAPEIIWPTGKLRSTALGAIIEDLSDEDLEKAYEKDRSLSVRQMILEELSARDNPKAATFAEEVVGRVDYPAVGRLRAARILLDIEGAKIAKDLIDIGVKVATPAVLRRGLAEMLADLNDEDVNKRLAKLVGKGRTPQKVFALLATRNVEGDKFLKKLRKGITAKEREVVVETLRALGARKDRESIEDLEKALGKAEDKGADVEIIEALLETLSIVHDGDNDWMARLEGFTSHGEAYLRNTALAEIARIGRASSVELFLERLKHPVWSTRLVALDALEGRREAKLIAPIVEQMQGEVGRMQLAFGDALFRLTGQPFGRRGKVWARWLKDQGADVKVIPESDVEKLAEAEAERRLKEVSQVEKESRFFGINIISERVLFIIDVSGSMAELLRADRIGESPPTRMDIAKRELKVAIEDLPPNALFNIVPFSGSAMSWMDGGLAASATETAKIEALLYVSRLDAAGGTNLYDALEYAFDDQDVDTIYLLSDGEPSIGDIIDPQLIREDIADLNENRGIEINCVAVGTGLQVLEWLAEDSGGVYVEVQ